MRTFVTAVAWVLGILFAILTLAAIAEGKPEAIVGFLIMAVGFALYFLPIIVAMARNHPATVAILLLNLFLGWTLNRLGCGAGVVGAADQARAATIAA
jgi:hypothetical protein